MGVLPPLDIDYSAHGGTGTRQTAEKTGNGVADPLSDQFTIRLVLGPGNIIGNQGGEQ